MNDYVFKLFIYAIVLFTAFPVHECCHALVAHWLGDDTAEREGRVTLNPFRHLSLTGTILMLVLGFGWAKAVPVNPNNFKNRKVGMMLTSLAGPASNLILSYISIIIYKILLYNYASSYDNDVLYYLTIAFRMIAIVNVGLAVFNLLPIPPLDGSKIFNAVLPEKAYFKIMQYENIIFMVLMLLSFTGLLSKPISFLQGVALTVLDFLSGWVDILMSAILR